MTCRSQVPNSNFAATGSLVVDVGWSISVFCDTGYSGTPCVHFWSTTTWECVVTCQSDGSFSDLPICTANDCASTQVENSDYSGAGSISGSTGAVVSVKCNAGYSGSGSVTCQSDGSFSALSCTVNPCAPTQVANSDYSGTGSITGSTGAVVSVTCDAGYSGSGSVTCQSDGSFSALSCTANPCAPTQVANSDYSGTGSITGSTGDVVSVTCNDGWSGSHFAECLPTGLFSLSICSAVSCGPLVVNNSDFSIDTAELFASVNVTCNFADEVLNVMCLASGPGASAWVETNFNLTNFTCPPESALSLGFSVGPAAVLAFLVLQTFL